MANMIPSTAPDNDVSMGEIDLFKRLKDDPGSEGWYVLHSLDIANHTRQASGEADFIVISPSNGVLCIEVKGCHKLRRENGLWYYGNSSKPDPRGPFKQSSEAMHSIRKRLIEKIPLYSNIIFWSCVVFPYIRFEVKSDEWHPWQVIDSLAYRSKPISILIDELFIKVKDFLRNCPSAKWYNPNSSSPNEVQCKEIVNRLRPDFEFFEDPKCRKKKITSEIKHYTEEQFIALDAMAANSRVVFTGPAGTGKTFLAIETARRALKTKKNILFICFNKYLCRWIKTQLGDSFDNITIRTIHKHMMAVARIEPKGYHSNFWENELPNLASEAFIDSLDNEGVLFDELIIDEGQDIIRDSYLDFLDLLLEGGLAAGKWRLFGDFENQAIYNAASLPMHSFLSNRSLSVPIYSLRVNCRNTPRIASYAQILGNMNPGYTKVLRHDDRIEPEIKYYCKHKEQVEQLIEILRSLYEQGFKGDDIIILSPFVDKSCVTRINEATWKNRLKPYGNPGKGYIKYCSIHAYKGLEANCVIITDIESIADNNANSLLYTGITRALSRLFILCCEPVKSEVINLLTIGK